MMTSEAILGHGKFPVALCKALRLNPEQTSGMTLSLRIYPEEVVVLTVDRYLTPAEADAVVAVVTEYELVAREKEG